MLVSYKVLTHATVTRSKLLLVDKDNLQAEHLASRPGYLALAVDGATPGPGLAACSVGGIPAQCRLRVVGGLIPLWDSNRVLRTFQVLH